ncbi:hypothetical protein DXG01_004756 [Tephrocybe rancida]|nr:hypothetical protein DXG01_004756 [Tephrocybe rancida]
MASHASRKSSYKLPPTTITDKLVSQETRRNKLKLLINTWHKALEEQKRVRLLATLLERRAQRFDSTRNLDTFADLTLGISEDEDDADADGDIPAPRPGSIAQYATMVAQPVDPSSIVTHIKPIPLTPPPEPFEFSIPEVGASSTPMPPKKAKKKRRGKPKPNKWADGCMYAELLEMVADPSETWNGTGDGLPVDLETGWVVLAPVPQGKRCLAVTQAAVGAPSHATLRSRLLGKTLLTRFPSTLPPHTVLDCVLDMRWKENGVLHVLDVIKWKGQDVSDCESAFRFWWRDTRLGELPPSAPPAFHPRGPDATAYTFTYPTTLLPVPYHTDTTLSFLLTHIIPSVRLPRSVDIVAPPRTTEGMDVDTAMHRREETVEPDGMLLYVKAASYEAGTSPLSSWVPIVSYDGPEHESPLGLFERLLRRRMERGGEVHQGDVDMEL